MFPIERHFDIYIVAPCFKLTAKTYLCVWMFLARVLQYSELYFWGQPKGGPF